MHRVCFLLFNTCVLFATIACQTPDRRVVEGILQHEKVLPDSAWWASSGIQLLPMGNTYEQVKSRVSQERKALNTAFQKGNITLDSARNAFTQNLLNRIIPYWYGTPWSFEGHTAIPGQGKIACGYFISTTLQDVGLRLNRYRLAQQSPSDETAILSMSDTVHLLQRTVPDSAVADLKSGLREGLYFVGLGDSHVGYLLKWRGELLLLHSNYTTPAEVIIQPVTQSVFMGYNRFYISDITHNDRLIRHWLKEKEIPTQKIREVYIMNW